MAAAPAVRIFAFIAFGVIFWLLWQVFQTPAVYQAPKNTEPFEMSRDPLLDREYMKAPKKSLLILYLAIGEPPEPLHRVFGNNYAADNLQSDRINATILSLVRNREMRSMIKAMEDLERTWNHKFNYPWTFFNDEPFTEEFIRQTSAATNSRTYYGTYFEKDYILACK